jgi:hypothetical protein
MLGLLAFIPGIGPIISIGSSIIGTILRCKPCLIALAISAAFIAGDIHGRGKERAACRAADIAMQLKAAQRDVAIQNDTIQFKQQQIDDLSKETDDLKRQKDAYDKAASDSKTVSCPIGDDRANRLRNITR